MCSEDWHVASLQWGWTTDVTWTILTMSLLPFWALNISVGLLSMQGQKALEFHKKYINLCSEDEHRSYGFGTSWGWVIYDRIFIFGWTIPLMFSTETWYQTPLKTDFMFQLTFLFKILIWFKERTYLTVHVNMLFSVRAVRVSYLVYRAVCSDWGNLEREELMERAPSSSLIHSLPHSSYKHITLLNEKRVCVRQRLSGISLKIGKFSTNFNSDTICTWNKVITDNLCKFLVLWSCYTEARSCNSSIKNACFRVCYWLLYLFHSNF